MSTIGTLLGDEAKKKKKDSTSRGVVTPSRPTVVLKPVAGSPGDPGKTLGDAASAASTRSRPSSQTGGSYSANSGGGGISSAEASARAQGKSQSKAENDKTQGILDALLNSLAGFQTGRDVQIANANRSMNDTLRGIKGNYDAAIADYDKTADINDQDHASKTAANISNRARERMALVQQAASQGAGETDQLRSQMQAFLNADENQLGIERANADTIRSIASQIAGANSQAEAQRRSAWAQNQEAIATAHNEFSKNWMDTMTNIQRTAASNNNIDSDYSEAFRANLRGYDPVSEIARIAGKTYQTESKGDEYFRNWEGRREGRESKSSQSNRAAAVSIKAPKSAEGATLRKRNA